jgi:hypothetical protein
MHSGSQAKVPVFGHETASIFGIIWENISDIVFSSSSTLPNTANP